MDGHWCRGTCCLSIGAAHTPAKPVRGPQRHGQAGPAGSCRACVGGQGEETDFYPGPAARTSSQALHGILRGYLLAA